MPTHTCFGNPCPICLSFPAVDTMGVSGPCRPASTPLSETYAWFAERDAALAGVERILRENAKLRHAVHMEVTEAGYTYDNALAEALRDLADAEKRAGNEEYNHKVTAEMLGGASTEVDRLRQRMKLIADRLAEFTSWTDETAAPDCDRRENKLCEWHNRLLSAVNQVRAIATEGSDA